jgi:hypothetical protein
MAATGSNRAARNAGHMPASKPTATEASKPGAIAHSGTLAVLDLTQKGANAAAVAQTPQHRLHFGRRFALG